MTRREILHSYKIYKPEVQGGIPEVISTLVSDDASSNAILVARRRGRAQNYAIDGIPVTAAASLGYVASMPIAPGFPRLLFQLAQRSDVVVHHAPFPLADLGIAAGLPSHVGLIVFWHAEIVGRRFLKSLVLPLLHASLRRADKIVVSHESILERSAMLGAYHAKVEVVPFGTDLEYWSKLEPEQAVRAEQLRRQYPRLIVFVGRLVDYKGLEMLIDAVGRIDAQLMIVGDGPLRDSLARRLSGQGLTDRIMLAGQLGRDEVKCLLHAAKALALPSINAAEAFGIIQIEAMAAGCPIVNTNLPTAVPHVARHQREALTVPPGDPHGLAQALQSVLDDPQLQSRLSSAARRRALSHYHAGIFRTRMSEIYDQVITARRRIVAAEDQLAP